MAFSQGQRMEIPIASSFTKPRKTGQLRKLTRRGWLYPGSWKTRYCVLDGSKLYFYDNDQSKGTERTSGVLNLDYFDICEEGKPKDKRASNVFVISTSVRGIFDLQTRHFFSADTLPEMNEWIHLVRKAIADARNNRSRAGRSKGNNNNCSGTEGGGGSLNTNNNKAASLRSQRSTHQEGSIKSTSPDLIVDGSEASSPDNRLYTPTKNRAKGPTGRRLPQRKSLMPMSQDNEELEDPEGPQRSRSMSALECIAEGENADNSWLSSPLELTTTEGRSASQNALVYKYSSSEESLDLPEQGRVKQLSMMLKIPTQKPDSRIGHPGTPSVAGIRERRSETDNTDLSPSSQRSVPSYTRNPRATLNSSLESSPIYKPKNYESAGNNSPVLVFTRQLTSLETKVQGLEQEMVVTRSDLASVHGGVSKAQAEVDRVSQRLERVTTQIIQVEKQMASMMNEAQKCYEDAERSSREAGEARQEYQLLKKECENVLLMLQTQSINKENSKSNEQ